MRLICRTTSDEWVDLGCNFAIVEVREEMNRGPLEELAACGKEAS